MTLLRESVIETVVLAPDQPASPQFPRRHEDWSAPCLSRIEGADHFLPVPPTPGLDLAAALP